MTGFGQVSLFGHLQRQQRPKAILNSFCLVFLLFRRRVNLASLWGQWLLQGKRNLRFLGVTSSRGDSWKLAVDLSHNCGGWGRWTNCSETNIRMMADAEMLCLWPNWQDFRISPQLRIFFQVLYWVVSNPSSGQQLTTVLGTSTNGNHSCNHCCWCENSSFFEENLQLNPTFCHWTCINSPDWMPVTSGRWSFSTDVLHQVRQGQGQLWFQSHLLRGGQG